MSYPTRAEQEARIEALQRQMRVLQTDIAVLVNAVEAWPEHPWIPGAAFKTNPTLTATVKKYRPLEGLS